MSITLLKVENSAADVRSREHVQCSAKRRNKRQKAIEDAPKATTTQTHTKNTTGGPKQMIQ